MANWDKKPCWGGANFISQFPGGVAEAWLVCERGDWMLWALRHHQGGRLYTNAQALRFRNFLNTRRDALLANAAAEPDPTRKAAWQHAAALCDLFAGHAVATDNTQENALYIGVDTHAAFALVDDRFYSRLADAIRVVFPTWPGA